MSGGRDRFLPLHEAAAVAAELGLPITEHFFASSADDAVNAAFKIGYPVVLKAVSPGVLHKSEAGGVKLSIGDEEGVRSAYEEIREAVTAAVSPEEFAGVSVSPMMPEGLEVIIGLVTDEELGRALMFGMGGVAVEIYRDVVFRLTPSGRDDIMEMIQEVRGFELLTGYRGSRPVDIDALADCLEILSEVPLKMPRIVELEINPLILYGEGCKAVDIRVSIRQEF